MNRMSAGEWGGPGVCDWAVMSSLFKEPFLLFSTKIAALKFGRVNLGNTTISEYMERGGKRSATPLWRHRAGLNQQKRRRRFALPAHSIWRCIQDAPNLFRRAAVMKEPLATLEPKRSKSLRSSCPTDCLNP